LIIMGWEKNLTIVALAGVTGYIWAKLVFGEHPLPVTAVPVRSAPNRSTPKTARPRIRYRAKADSKVLHQAGCRYYDRENLGKGFASLDEAIAAGYRACRICIESS
jgi:hypothetical protein